MFMYWWGGVRYMGSVGNHVDMTVDAARLEARATTTMEFILLLGPPSGPGARPGRRGTNQRWRPLMLIRQRPGKVLWGRWILFRRGNFLRSAWWQGMQSCR